MSEPMQDSTVVHDPDMDPTDGYEAYLVIDQASGENRPSVACAVFNEHLGRKTGQRFDKRCRGTQMQAVLIPDGDIQNLVDREIPGRTHLLPGGPENVLNLILFRQKALHRRFGDLLKRST